MLETQIFPEAGGLVAAGRTHHGRHLILRVSRDWQSATATLNRHELQALITSLQVDLAILSDPATPPPHNRRAPRTTPTPRHQRSSTDAHQTTT